MMNRVLALEERLLEIVGDTKRDVVDQQVLIERHEAMLNRVMALEERSMEIHADTRSQLAEMREDSKKWNRLWVRLAQKHGWIDDEDII